MDDYMDESCSQDDEEAVPETEAQVSYLDDDDVQLREPDLESSDKLDSSAMNFEEELVKLRKLCKGINFCNFFVLISYELFHSVFHFYDLLENFSNIRFFLSFN